MNTAIEDELTNVYGVWGNYYQNATKLTEYITI